MGIGQHTFLLTLIAIGAICLVRSASPILRAPERWRRLVAFTVAGSCAANWVVFVFATVTGNINGFATHSMSNRDLVEAFLFISLGLLLFSASVPVSRKWLVGAALSMLMLWLGSGLVL